MSEIPKALFRNTELQYANSFVEEGELLFRPLSYFRAAEGASKDEHEGHILRDLSGAKIQMQDPVSMQWQEIDFQNGNFIHKLDEESSDRLLVKCFSHRERKWLWIDNN
jgi:hypothetical protein